MAKDLNNQETTGGLIGGWIGVIMLFVLIFWTDFGVWGSLLTSVFTGAIITAMIDALGPKPQTPKEKPKKTPKAKTEKTKKPTDDEISAILERFSTMRAKKEAVRYNQPKQESNDDDFDLPGYGSVIWNSSEGLPINFNYIDSDGNYTERTVVLHRLYKDSKTRFYFQGYCLMRKALRTFVSDRVQDIYDLNGELFEIPQFINNLTGYPAFGSNEVREVETKEKKKNKR